MSRPIQPPPSADGSDATPPPQPLPQQHARPVWAAPEPQWQLRQTEPLAYHELLRGIPRYRWWKPLVGMLLGIIYFATFSTVFTVLVLAVAVVARGEQSLIEGLARDQELLLELALPDTQRPLSLVLTLGTIIFMIPAAGLAMWSVGARPFTRLHSVALGIRWRWLGRALLPALTTLVLIFGLGVGFDALFSGGENSVDASASALPSAAGPPADFSVPAALWSVLLILLLVPFQAAAEELIFRGALMQLIGSWRGRDWAKVLLTVAVPLLGLAALALVLFVPLFEALPQGDGGGGQASPSNEVDAGLAAAWQWADALILAGGLAVAAVALRWKTGSPFLAVFLPSLLFGLMHIYDRWGLLTVGAMAVCFSWLSWRTGGLEMAIAYHTVNNVVVFLLMAWAVDGETGQTATGGSPASFLLSLIGLVGFCVWMDRSFQRHDGRRTRIDLVQVKP